MSLISICGNFVLEPVDSNFELRIFSNNFVCHGIITAQFRVSQNTEASIKQETAESNGFMYSSCSIEDSILTLTFMRCSQKPIVLSKGKEIGVVEIKG